MAVINQSVLKAIRAAVDLVESTEADNDPMMTVVAIRTLYNLSSKLLLEYATDLMRDTGFSIPPEKDDTNDTH